MVQGGPNSGMIVPLMGNPLTLGRRSDNDVMDDETTVSRRHALVMETPSGFVLRDLNSTNGTFINGNKLGVGEHILKHGDRLRLAGSGVTYQFRQEGSDTKQLKVESPATGSFDMGAPPVQAAQIEPPPPEPAAPDAEPQPAGKEAELLRFLESRKGSAVSREELARFVWPELAPGSTTNQEIDQTIERLRGQVEPDPSRPIHLITVGEFGYLWV